MLKNYAFFDKIGDSYFLMGNYVFYGNHLKMLPQTHMDNWASKIFVHPAV
ncbi:Uncharacterised protein [Streptococcus pneumoniae]|nr:Uncharacterised protein [Streptococcus pneumoniae]